MGRCEQKPKREFSELRPSDLLTAYFLVAILYVIGALALGVTSNVAGAGNARWAVLHMVFVGGVSQMVFGAAQFFAGAALATVPPPRRLVRSQLVTWNVGALLMLSGGPASSNHLMQVGAGFLLVGLGLFALALRKLRQRSLQRMPWATRWYTAAAAFFSLGIAVGAILSAGLAWSRSDLLLAHLALNLIGWFGTAIVGTLHTFYPSLCSSLLWRPVLQKPTFVLWVGGTGLLLAALVLGLHPLALAGLAAVVVAAALLSINVCGTATVAGVRQLPFAARVVGAGQLFLLTGGALALVALSAGGYSLSGGIRGAVATLLLVGWLGLTVSGSLIHLLQVLARVRNLARTLGEAEVAVNAKLALAAVPATVLLAASMLAGIGWLRTVAGITVLAFFFYMLTVAVRLAYSAFRAAPLKL